MYRVLLCRALAFWGRSSSGGSHAAEAADFVTAAPQVQQQAYVGVDPAPPRQAYNVRGAPQATFLGAGWAALLLVRRSIAYATSLCAYAQNSSSLHQVHDNIQIACRSAPPS